MSERTRVPLVADRDSVVADIAGILEAFTVGMVCITVLCKNLGISRIELVEANLRRAKKAKAKKVRRT